jgi:MSHA type pilus biogenesis protein MshL
VNKQSPQHVLKPALDQMNAFLSFIRPRVWLALLTTLGVLTMGPNAKVPESIAATKKAPEFQDLPGVTIAQSQAPAAVQSPVNARPAPADKQAEAAPQQAPPTGTPTEPAAVVDDATMDKTLYSFQASDLELKAALASFARANNLNIVPDKDVTGSVTLDVRDLTLKHMMRALLEANDCTWEQQGGLIRVHSTETRTFNINYLRLSRKGMGQNSAMLGSGGGSGGMGGGMGGGGGGMGSMGGGGMSGGGGGAGGMGGGGNVFSSSSSAVNVTADNQIDFWKELTDELGFLLTPAGKTSLAINKTAGIIQLNDRPSALKRVEEYLKGVDRSIHRQVEIEAKLYDVTLNDQFQFGIDWVHLAEAYGGTMGFGGATLPIAAGGAQLGDSAVGGINRFPIVGTIASTKPGVNASTLVFENFNTAAAVNALQQQGNVEVISTPRIRTMNNQTALIKVGEEVPFFSTSTSFQAGTSAGTTIPLQETIVTSYTIGTILSITPQISENDWVSLDISPVLTKLNSIISSAGNGSGSGGGGGGGGNSGSSATAPDLDTKQASTLVRVRDGTTVVMGGLIQTQEAKNKTKIPLLGDIPLMGKLFTGTFRFKQRKELVMFVTPHIIREGFERPIPVVPSGPERKDFN